MDGEESMLCKYNDVWKAGIFDIYLNLDVYLHQLNVEYSPSAIVFCFVLEEGN